MGAPPELVITRDWWLISNPALTSQCRKNWPVIFNASKTNHVTLHHRQPEPKLPRVTECMTPRGDTVP